MPANNLSLLSATNRDEPWWRVKRQRKVTTLYSKKNAGMQRYSLYEMLRMHRLITGVCRPWLGFLNLNRSASTHHFDHSATPFLI